VDADESLLVQQARSGQPQAFDELTRRHRPSLVRFAAYMTGDADEAESLAQEALTRALARLAEFEPGRSFGAWLRGIALNLCRSHLRDRARRARPVDPQELGGAAAAEGRRHGALSGLLRREQNDHAMQALAELPTLLREAFVLRILDELDYDTIGELTGATPASVRARVHRARGLLRQRLGSVVDTWLREDRPDGNAAPESPSQNRPFG
jgi:RNA polymerase sigma-70 factor (ECF subfamily)